MGWSFSYFDVGRKAHIESLVDSKHFSEGYTSLAHRVVGNNVWQAVRRPNGEVLICLDLIAKERGGGWGNKGISEDMGPCEVNCPLSLLAMCTPAEPGSYAEAWREKVHAYHAKRKAAKAVKPKPGLVVTYGGEEYTLLEPLGSRRGWYVEAKYGGRYRMKARQLASAIRSMQTKETTNEQIREAA